jgi:ubiquinone/menaquinone biosynthesis C-methylase UbiE
VDIDPRWHESFFGEDWLRIALSFPDERADQQTEFIVTALGLEPGARVLDLACGHGRHSARLARRGFAVTGLDNSAQSLVLARESAPEAEFVEGDMRELPFEDGSFDAVINMFTAFGYFDHEEEDAWVLHEVARILRPTGAFLIDMINPPGLFARYRDDHWERLDDDTLFLQQHEYDVLAGRAKTYWTLIFADGGRRELRHSVRTYTAPELVRLSEAAGLQVVRSWGDFDGSELTRESARLILRADKPAQS